MKTFCLKCKRELNATEEQQRCICGIYYGLTPYFQYQKGRYRGTIDEVKFPLK